MKIFILVIIMFIMTSVVRAGNEVYINQSGSGLDLDITLDGDGAKVGTDTDITQIKGDDLDIIIDLKGTNTIIGDIYVTSGLDKIYPKGIKVGKVSSVIPTSDSQFVKIVIAPFTRPETSSQVTIITPSGTSK